MKISTVPCVKREKLSNFTFPIIISTQSLNKKSEKKIMKDCEFILQGKRKLTDNIFEFTLFSEEELPPVRCGQFLHLKIGGKFLLRRPFCIYKFDAHTVTIAVAIVGGGTRYMSELSEGCKLSAVMPIGNGFTLDSSHRKIVLLGGGVGCAPLATVPITYPGKEYFSYLGFANKNAIAFTEEFGKFGSVVTCTDDGSYGRKGYVTSILSEDIKKIKPDVILTCGPTPMLKAAAKLSLETGVPAYMSGESRMGCGVGACLVCTCAVKNADGTVSNKRVCVDGPVFNLEDIIL